jgi:hypothetical protein
LRKESAPEHGSAKVTSGEVKVRKLGYIANTF